MVQHFISVTYNTGDLLAWILHMWIWNACNANY